MTRETVQDMVVLLGVALLTWGIWRYSMSLGLIALGTLLVAVGVLWSGR